MASDIQLLDNDQIVTQGNFGVGVTPAFRLDVGGRMQVRQTNANESAGIWFSPSKPNKGQAFVGMSTDTQVGFWGNTGAQWGLVMDTTTGNVGIGMGQQVSPAIKLAVKGDTALIGSLTATGALTSTALEVIGNSKVSGAMSVAGVLTAKSMGCTLDTSTAARVTAFDEQHISISNSAKAPGPTPGSGGVITQTQSVTITSDTIVFKKQSTIKGPGIPPDSVIDLVAEIKKLQAQVADLQNKLAAK